ncbi:MAG: regulatory protein RecX [Pseudomonadota bacterium]
MGFDHLPDHARAFFFADRQELAVAQTACRSSKNTLARFPCRGKLVETMIKAGFCYRGSEGKGYPRDVLYRKRGKRSSIFQWFNAEGIRKCEVPDYRQYEGENYFHEKEPGNRVEEILEKKLRDKANPEMEQALDRSAVNLALRLLSRRSHTCRELSLKLHQRGFERAIVDQVVAECARLTYLDDEAFARMYRKQMTEKGYGARYIKVAMKKKGLSDQDIAASFTDYDMVADERTVAEAALVKKVKTLSHLPEGRKKKDQLCRFLSSRGFSTSTVCEVLNMIRPDT